MYKQQCGHLGTWGAVALPYARPLTPGTTTEADERSRSNDVDRRRTNERRIERTTATAMMGRRSDPECPRRNTRKRRYRYPAQVWPLPVP